MGGADNLSEIQQYRERLSVALKAAKICVFEVDLVRQLYTFFENAEDIFGVSGGDILRDVQQFSRLSPAEYQKAASGYFSHPDDRQIITEAFKSIYNGSPTTYEARMRAGGSRFKWCKIDVTPILENGKPVKMIGVITDISNIKRRTDYLINEVKLDNFTGLYNKKYATLAIKKVLSSEKDKQHALVLIDIDNFKKINDTYGHSEGDKIIRAVADCLKSHFRKSDIVSRFGGDEYLILVRDIPDIGWLKGKLSEILNCSCPPYGCTNSIGVSVYPKDGHTFDTLFKNADKALYSSKAKRCSHTFFSDLLTP